jgi:transcriptional regulator with XRE-family HTH domain
MTLVAKYDIFLVDQILNTGNEIKQFISDMGITQIEFARYLDMWPETISRMIAKGGENIRIKRHLKIAMIKLKEDYDTYIQ